MIAQAGERVCGRLPVENGVLPDGTRVEIPVIVVNGDEKGPVFSVLAAVHGSEVTGTPAIINVGKELRAERMAGTLIGLPAANPLAYVTQTRGWVMDEPQAVRNLNRAFPGNPYGTITERIAYTIFTEVILRSTVMLDYHTGGYMVPMVGYRYGFGDLSRKSFELADVAATAVVWKTPLHPGTTHTEAAKRGVISLDAETEGGLGMPAREEHIQLWEKTILNIMKRLGMIPGEPEFPEHVYVETEREATIGSGFTTIDPVKHGGFMTPLVKLMDRVSKGQRLASITNLYGDEVDAIYAPCDDGIVLSIGANVVQPGGTPIAVGHIIPRGDLD
ncbi:MAG: succinylglutamate desuccinylase/aspartoacylase family protein [Candidatus Bathyarchaeia archaeon]